MTVMQSSLHLTLQFERLESLGLCPIIVQCQANRQRYRNTYGQCTIGDLYHTSQFLPIAWNISPGFSVMRTGIGRSFFLSLNHTLRIGWAISSAQLSFFHPKHFVTASFSEQDSFEWSWGKPYPNSQPSRGRPPVVHVPYAPASPPIKI